ncbi:MAG TPA: hypothetical protein VF173_19145 [Thermoanaerobaculia bacterium]|nr:hypothetical protein [Thermoanaerobaculia bacterium]
MKKRKPSKLSLSRETLRSLTDIKLAGGAVIVVGPPPPLSIPMCTQAISDCYRCTVFPDVCPSAMGCPSSPPMCGVA